MNPDFENYLLTTTQSAACEEVELIQSLWSGYGSISRYLLTDSRHPTVVIKCIAPNLSAAHPRGWNSDRSHQRKVKSYEVETQWYKAWSERCTLKCKVPQFLGSFSQGNEHWIILEDLQADFPMLKQQVDLKEVKVCLRWLANFHATFLDQKPEGLWEVGTYWHLETRPDEFEKIGHQALKAKAHLIDEKLRQCRYQTIVHGDAKLANFCFSENGEQVAAVDFQYVGGGCGMKDVAYFLGSCLSSTECATLENVLLDTYFSALEHALEYSRQTFDFNALELEWRAMYPFACADFTRFMLGWMPSHQKVNSYNLKMIDTVLDCL